MLRVLLNHKEIDVNCRSADTTKTPLHLAAELGRKEIAKLLLQHESIGVNLRTSEWSFLLGVTALQIAQMKGHAELAELLLVHGAVE
jgi:ankyrin repeat protein